MPNKELPEWLRFTVFTGREDDDDKGDGDGDGEGDDSEDDGSEGGEGEGGEGDSGSDNDDDTEGLKKALATERSKAKRLERENKRLKRKTDQKKDQESDEEKQNLQEASEKLNKSEEKVSRLATRLLNRERDAAIKTEAEKQGFIDPSDALTDEIRNAIDIDQDDEDPSDIDIDETSVTNAVKKLANRKKHLIGKPNGGAPSGSRLRRDAGSGDGASEQKLTDLYPSLQ